MTLDDVLKRIGDVAEFCEGPPADPNQRGLFDTYPLHVAAVWGDCEAIRILIEAGARIDQRGEHGFTPLMEAVAQGHRDAVFLLIDLGAGAERNDDGDLPSGYARVAGDEELAKFLAARGF